MAELVDAQDSKSCDRKVMRVRFSLRANGKYSVQETTPRATRASRLFLRAFAIAQHAVARPCLCAASFADYFPFDHTSVRVAQW